MKKLDEKLMLDFLEQHSNLVTKKEKSAFFTRISTLLGVDKKLFKESFYRFRTKKSTEWSRKKRNDYGKIRVGVSQDQFFKDIHTISAIAGVNLSFVGKV